MTQKRTSNSLETNFQELSIQVSLSGLSFCILDTLEKRVLFQRHISFAQKLYAEALPEQLLSVLNSVEALSGPFQKVQVIHHNELLAFVPKALFDENSLADYLKFSVKILANDFITYDEIATSDLMTVYVPFTNVNNVIFDHFGEFEYRHSATVLLTALWQQKPTVDAPIMYAFLEKDQFQLIVLHQKKLLLFNTFTYHTKEDFLYYILFTAEQLQLNLSVSPLTIIGDIDENHPLYKIAYTYIHTVTIHKPVFAFADAAETKPEHFIILNSL